MDHMLGRAEKSPVCRYGCCRRFANNGRRASVRSAKRRERRAWRAAVTLERE